MLLKLLADRIILASIKSFGELWECAAMCSSNWKFSGEYCGSNGPVHLFCTFACKLREWTFIKHHSTISPQNTSGNKFIFFLHADTTPKLTHADLKLKIYSQFQLCGWRAKIVNEQFTSQKKFAPEHDELFPSFWQSVLSVVFFDHQCTRTTVMIFISLRNYTQVWKGCVLCLWKLCDLGRMVSLN